MTMKRGQRTTTQSAAAWMTTRLPTAGWERAGDQKRSRAHSPADRASGQGEEEVQQDREETIRRRRRYSRMGKRRAEGGGTAG